MRIASKKPFGTHPIHFFRLEDVQISHGSSGPSAVGRIGREPYDPLAIYYQAEERRGGSIPPHLEFARLSGDDDDAKEFLEMFGPLTTVGAIQPDDAAEEELDLTWRVSVRDKKQRLTNSAEYFRNSLFAPTTYLPQSSDSPGLARVNLGDFWAEQEEFLFLYLLIDVIRSGRSVSEARSLLTRFVAQPPNARIGAFVLTPEIYADLQIVFGVRSPHHNTHQSYGEILKKALLPQIKKSSDQEIASAAIRLVQLRVNSRLSTTFPLLSVIDSGSIRRGIKHSWSCRNLIGALYMMLFLDIEHQRRVVRCEGCGVLFQDAKDNVLYCSSRCETRTRVRKWWRKKGKNYRAKQRKKSKVAGKSKSVPKSDAGFSSRGRSRA